MLLKINILFALFFCCVRLAWAQPPYFDMGYTPVIVADPPAPWAPCQTVKFTILIQQYNSFSGVSSWFHGLGIKPGDCWQDFIYGPPPPAYSAGQFRIDTSAYFNNPQLGNCAGKRAWSGFFIDNPSGFNGQEPQEDPGNNWGDTSTGGPWQFTWTARVPCEASPGCDLSMQAQAYSDGETGSWGSAPPTAPTAPPCGAQAPFVYPTDSLYAAAIGFRTYNETTNVEQTVFCNNSVVKVRSNEADLSLYTFSWDFGGGTVLGGSGGGPYLIKYTTPGVKTITRMRTTISSGETLTTERTITINVPPTALIAGLDAPFCLPTPPTSLTATPFGGTFWLNDTIPLPNGFFAPETLGIGYYTIKYTGVAAACAYSTTKSVWISKTPVLSASTVNPQCNLCPTGKITATASGGIGPYQYQLNDGLYQSSAVFQGLVGGTYLVRVKDVAGCEGILTITLVGVNSCPVPTNLSATYLAPGSYLIGWTTVPGAANYTLRYKAVSATNWTTLTISGTSRQLSGLSPQEEYEVQVRANCITIGAGAYSPSVITGTAPDPGCQNPTNVTINNISETSALVKWTPGAGATSYQVQYRRTSGSTWQTATAPGTSYTITGLQSGYSYLARVRSVCGNNTLTWTSTVSFTTQNGTRNGGWATVADADETQITCYPNPNRGAFSLRFDAETTGEVAVKVFDVTGRAVYEGVQAASVGANELPIDLTRESAGLYTLQFRQGGTRRFLKVIVQ